MDDQFWQFLLTFSVVPVSPERQPVVGWRTIEKKLLEFTTRLLLCRRQPKLTARNCETNSGTISGRVCCYQYLATFSEYRRFLLQIILSDVVRSRIDTSGRSTSSSRPPVRLFQESKIFHLT
jgi:hypothetical protein